MASNIKMQRGCVYQLEDKKRFLFTEEVGDLLGGTCLETGKNRYLKSGTTAVSLVEDRRITIRKSYITRSGLPVKIQETDILGDYCVLASIPTNGRWRMWTFLIDGRKYRDQDSPLDLLPYTPASYENGELVEIFDITSGWRLGSIQRKSPGYADKYSAVFLDEKDIEKGVVPDPRKVQRVEVQGIFIKKLSRERNVQLMNGLQELYKKSLVVEIKA